MKVWNFRVTLCWAKPVSAGAPRATAAPDCRSVLRWIMKVSPGELNLLKPKACSALGAEVKPGEWPHCNGHSVAFFPLGSRPCTFSVLGGRQAHHQAVELGGEHDLAGQAAVGLHRGR